MPITELPQRARVVVVGGGVIGCSVAYHLAALGWTDVVLLERDRLTSGTTWHAAGLMVTFGSTSRTSTEMRIYTRDLYRRLEAETGQSTGFRPVGFVELATEPDRLEEYRRVAAVNRYHGVDVHEISAREVAGLFPPARTDDVLAGFYVPDDGRANPVDVTMALARGARQRGVRIVEGCRVTTVLTRRGPGGLREVAGVRVVRADGTRSGGRSGGESGGDGSPVDVEAEYVVNCAGMWARQLAETSGVRVPLQAAEHYYLLTDRIPGIGADWPVLEDPRHHGYYREESGGLMVGVFEPVAAPWHVDAVPADFSFGSIPPDWDRMAPYLRTAMSRVPAAADAGVRALFCGPESFTPDLRPAVGEAPEVRRYFVAAGMNSIGILTGGGIGRAVARWIVDGEPDVDVTGIGVDRLHAHQTTPAYRADRTAESLGLVYACHYPTHTPHSARGARRSPLHDRLAGAGACFRDVSGWEAADWYAAPGEPPDAGEPSWGRAPWFARWEAEHRAVREGVAVADLSFLATFRVSGPEAGAVLERLSAARVGGAPGRVTRTPWLNPAGGVDADVVVTELDDDEFLVVTSETAHRHVLTRLRRHVATHPGSGPDGARAAVTDVTGARALLGVAGPRSRELLQPLTSADLSDEAFGRGTARELDLGYARVLCVRAGQGGELGYELHVPAEHALEVYDRLVAPDGAVRPVHAGLRALSSLRLEQGDPEHGQDVVTTDSVFEAGYEVGPGAAVDVDKPGGFVGRDAVAAALAAGAPPSPARRPARRLARVLVLDPEPLMWHAEVVYRDGVPVGCVRSASYGWTLGGAVGLAMIEPGVHGAARPVDEGWLGSGRWEVDIAGRRYPARTSLRPLRRLR